MSISEEMRRQFSEWGKKGMKKRWDTWRNLPPEEQEKQRQALREAGRRGAAKRWGKDLT